MINMDPRTIRIRRLLVRRLFLVVALIIFGVTTFTLSRTYNPMSDKINAARFQAESNYKASHPR